MVKLQNFKESPITPVCRDPTASQFLKALKLTPQRASFELVGCHTALANGLRRMILGSVPVKHMTLSQGATIQTNDPFLIRELLEERLEAIPLDQTVPETATYSLQVASTSGAPIYVVSANLQGGPAVFDGCIPLVLLQPGKTLSITGIKIATSKARHNGRAVAAFAAVCEPLDVEMWHPETKQGQRSSMAAPRHHRVSFETNGTQPPRKIVAAACAQFLEAVDTLADSVDKLMFDPKSNMALLTVPGLDDTVGNACVAQIAAAKSAIATYTVNNENKTLTLSIRAPDPRSVILEACKAISLDISAIQSGL